jgi:dUTP pyrophosphatase
MPIKAIDIKRIDSTLPLPEAEPQAAGFDLPCRTDVEIPPGKIGVVPVNSVVKVPDGFFLLIALRSHTPIKKGLVLANGVGIVDPFYCGDRDEIIIQLYNISNDTVRVSRGESLAQGIFIPMQDFSWREVANMDPPGNGYDLNNANQQIVCP